MKYNKYRYNKMVGEEADSDILLEVFIDRYKSAREFLIEVADNEDAIKKSEGSRESVAAWKEYRKALRDIINAINEDGYYQIVELEDNIDNWEFFTNHPENYYNNLYTHKEDDGMKAHIADKNTNEVIDLANDKDAIKDIKESREVIASQVEDCCEAIEDLSNMINEDGHYRIVEEPNDNTLAKIEKLKQQVLNEKNGKKIEDDKAKAERKAKRKAKFEERKAKNKAKADERKVKADKRKSKNKDKAEERKAKAKEAKAERKAVAEEVKAEYKTRSETWKLNKDNLKKNRDDILTECKKTIDYLRNTIKTSNASIRDAKKKMVEARRGYSDSKPSYLKIKFEHNKKNKKGKKDKKAKDKTKLSDIFTKVKNFIKTAVDKVSNLFKKTPVLPTIELTKSQRKAINRGESVISLNVKQTKAMFEDNTHCWPDGLRGYECKYGHANNGGTNCAILTKCNKGFAEATAC